MEKTIMSSAKNSNIHTSINWLILSSLFLLISACGSDYPKLTHFKAFDERFTTVIDTSDPKQLALLSELFFNRLESNDVTAALDFKYLFDISTKDSSERWRCTKNGYCQQRVQGAEPLREIYYVERYKELFARSNLD